MKMYEKKYNRDTNYCELYLYIDSEDPILWQHFIMKKTVIYLSKH